MTDFIVLARAGSYLEQEHRTQFERVRSLKGEIPANFEVRTYSAFMGETEAAEDDFSGVRPRQGSCNADGYRAGRLYVLFLRAVEGDWAPFGPPFSRINEEVAEVDSPWVLAVAEYVRVSALGNYDAEKAELEHLMKRSGETDSTPVPLPGLAADIATHFAAPTEAKTFVDLLAIYEAAPSAEVRNTCLWAMANREDPEAMPLFSKLLAAGDTGRNGVVVAYLAQSGRHEFLGRIAEIYLSRKPGDWMGRRPLLHAMTELARPSDVPLMLRVLGRSDDDEAEAVALWLSKYPGEEVISALRKRVAGKYVERWQLTFALAAAGDSEVTTWAGNWIKKAGDDRWIAIYAIARSPLAQADRLAGVLIAGRDKELDALVQGYEESTSPHAMSRLKEVVRMPDRPDDLVPWLVRTLTTLKEKGSAEAGDLLQALPVEAAIEDQEE